MSTIQRPSRRRLARHRRRGQSIPIIALMIVILVAMVGLSVDVGNTFSHERQAVSAGNAASIAGMTAYIQRTTGTTDKNIYDSIANSLRSNGINLGDGNSDTVAMTASYLNSQGEKVKDLLADGSTVPDNVGFIKVELKGDVNTSFARMVGRSELPINAEALAGLCPVNSGVYPIAIDSTTITDNQFNDTAIDKTDPAQYKIEYHLYKGYYQRRIYVKDDTTAGSFSYLRWMKGKGANGKEATSAFELAASLSGDGNIASGFEEAPWPAGKPLPSGGYTPDGLLDAGDWVWGSPGWKENNGGGKDGASVSAALDNHRGNQTRLILPIYNEIRGNDDNVQMRVQRLGIFVIVDLGKEPTKGPYFDLVYMGEPTKQYTACSVTPPPPNSLNFELAGNVSFYPEYQVTPDSQKPIQYVVVLDGSGSMSANFNGQCNNGGTTVQCANGPAGYPGVQVTDTGPKYWWTKTSERRIYVAKKALERLVRLANMPGNGSQYNTSRPPDQMAVVWFREYVPSSQTKAFSSDPDSIISYITNLNTTKSDNYRSEGGTNGAAGLYRASLLYDKAPLTTTYKGQPYTYKRVVLFITDGVSNQFLDTGADDLWGGKSDSGTYPKKSFCRGLGDMVVESSDCQTTDGADGSTYNGWDRPITQMINTSEQYLRNTKTNAAVFVVALSNLPSTGLRDGIPSSTSYYFSAEGLETYSDGTTNVDGIIDIINAEVEIGDCVPGPSGSPTNIINGSDFVGVKGLTYPVVGKVKIKSATDTLYADIKAATDGSLSYFFPSVPQGTYQLEAYIFYRHPLDPPGVEPRMYSKIWSAGKSLSDYTVVISPSTQGNSFVQRFDQPLTLKLNGEVCATGTL